jgi:hypothetical protein
MLDDELKKLMKSPLNLKASAYINIFPDGSMLCVPANPDLKCVQVEIEGNIF